MSVHFKVPLWTSYISKTTSPWRHAVFQPHTPQHTKPKARLIVYMCEIMWYPPSLSVSPGTVCPGLKMTFPLWAGNKKRCWKFDVLFCSVPFSCSYKCLQHFLRFLFLLLQSVQFPKVCMNKVMFCDLGGQIIISVLCFPLPLLKYPFFYLSVSVWLVAGVFDCRLYRELIGSSLAARTLKAGLSPVPVGSPLPVCLFECVWDVFLNKTF